MNTFRLRLTWLASLAMVAFPVVRAHAQNAKPVAVISLSSVDELLDDIGYLTRAAGQPQIGAFVPLLAGQYIQDMDTQRPVGVYITLDGGEPNFVGFLPVTNFDSLLGKIEEQVGDAEDLGNGVKRFSSTQDVFVKQANGWAFISNSAANLNQLPQDPAMMLGNLDKQYDFAIRAFVRNLPQQLRDQAINQIKEGFEASLEQQAENDDVDRELAEKLGRNTVESFVRLIEDSDQVTIGWVADSQKKKTFLDFALTAVAGSELAQQYAAMNSSSSDFTGFLMDDAAATMNFTTKIAERDIEQTTLMLQTVREQALEELSKDSTLPNEKARSTVKEVVNTLFDVLHDTVKTGKMDGGLSVVLNPGVFSLVGGGFVADGKKIEEALKKLVEVAKDEPDFPVVKFNAAQHAGVTFHSMTIPIPDEEDARKVFGESIDVSIGLGQKSFYVAAGEGSVRLLQGIIDRSAQQVNKEVLPLQLNIAVSPILRFVASVSDENTAQIATAALDAGAVGTDHIRLTAKSIERGAIYRLEIEEGVLRILGKMAPTNGPGF